MRRWLLPEHIEDVLPAEARSIERLRRAILDLFERHGYELVAPPMLEYVESLLSGTGKDMDLATFKLVDQLSGRMLGVRADHTPQVARIDAHLLNRQGVTRLCYCGSVLHTVPAGMTRTREPIQIGAELYGHADIAADRETMGLLVSSLTKAGVTGLHLDLGHVGVYRALAAGAGIAGNAEDGDLFAALRAKDAPVVGELTSRLPVAWRDALRALPELYGPAASVLAEARARLPDTPAIANALSALDALAQGAAGEVVALHVDLADLTGYHYQNGAIFSVFTAGQTRALGNGGRYDGIGKAFGRARPATGFTLDLRHLAEVTGGASPT